MVEIAYVCSPDFSHYLLSSLRSLLISGTYFDRISIYFIGSKPHDLSFRDDRIQVNIREPLDENYFLINKVYALDTDADTLIFLDTDTIVLKPLNEIIFDDFEFAGRPASFFENNSENKTTWFSYLNRYSVKQRTPYFNSGFFIFKNQPHRKLFHEWKDLTKKIYISNEHYHDNDKRLSEQVALSLLVGEKNLICKILTEKQHSYGWKNEMYHFSVVYHTGTSRFNSMVTQIELHKKFFLFKSTTFFSDKGDFKKKVLQRYIMFIKHRLLAKIALIKKSLTRHFSTH
jgi:hypothetical protein